jgi:hypothetical protein
MSDGLRRFHIYDAKVGRVENPNAAVNAILFSENA